MLCDRSAELTRLRVQAVNRCYGCWPNWSPARPGSEGHALLVWQPVYPRPELLLHLTAEPLNTRAATGRQHRHGRPL